MLYREREFIPESHRPCSHPYFFVTRSGQRLSKRQINEQFRRLTGKLGLDALTPHSLRHLYGYFSAVVLEMGQAIIQRYNGPPDLFSAQIYTQIPSTRPESALHQASDELPGTSK